MIVQRYDEVLTAKVDKTFLYEIQKNSEDRFVMHQALDDKLKSQKEKMEAD